MNTQVTMPQNTSTAVSGVSPNNIGPLQTVLSFIGLVEVEKQVKGDLFAAAAARRAQLHQMYMLCFLVQHLSRRVRFRMRRAGLGAGSVTMKFSAVLPFARTGST